MASYDEILYPSIARLQTHPSRMATVGILFGMDPAPVQRCRVLELGCGNEPVYFSEFMEQAEQHGLQFLGEADFHDMLDQRFPPNVVEKLNQIAQSRVDREQYMDFLRCRRFRQTLLCHHGIPLNLSVKSDLATRFFAAALALPVTKNAVPHDASLVRYQNPQGATYQTDRPLEKLALAHLLEQWPVPVAFDDLLDEARRRLAAAGGHAADSDGNELAKALLSGYALGLVEFHTYLPECFRAISPQPKASPRMRPPVPVQL